jgi:hypothetical protein
MQVSGPNDIGYGITENGLWANNRAFDIGDLISDDDYDTYGDPAPISVSGNNALIAAEATIN